MFETLVIGAAFFFLDQFSKKIAELYASDSESRGVLPEIRVVSNPFFNRWGLAVPVMALTWMLAVACAVALWKTGLWFQNRAALIGLGLAFGGAAGNLCDVWRRRAVVDFIDLKWWPVFNLADVGIVGGLGLAFLSHT